MSFAKKYNVVPIVPLGRLTSGKTAPQDRLRTKLLEAIKLQEQILSSELDGREFTIVRDGKCIRPRTFWQKTANGVAFTPRLGNKFIFKKNQGVVVLDLAELSKVLQDFAESVRSREFDAHLLEIRPVRRSRARTPTAAAQQPAE